MPVVMVQNEVKKGSPDKIEVLVDNMTCVENITRYAQSQGYQVNYSTNSEGFLLNLSK